MYIYIPIFKGEHQHNKEKSGERGEGRGERGEGRGGRMNIAKKVG